MGFVATVEVKQNLIITARERGKVVARREGHNIWLNLGREYLAQLIAFSSFGPDTPYRNDRIKYMGLGIGGNRQLAVGAANSGSVGTAYPGSNTQTDTDATVTTLERPVRLTGGETAYPGIGTDVWLAEVAAPPTFPLTTQTKFIRTFSSAEVSYGSLLSVPLSEVGLFTSISDPTYYLNTMVAYDTFDTISKTAAFELEIDWTIRF